MTLPILRRGSGARSREVIRFRALRAPCRGGGSRKGDAAEQGRAEQGRQAGTGEPGVEIKVRGESAVAQERRMRGRVRETGSAGGVRTPRVARTRVCTQRVRDVDVDVGSIGGRGGRSMRRDAGRRTFRRPLRSPIYATPSPTTAVATRDTTMYNDIDTPALRYLKSFIATLPGHANRFFFFFFF